MQGNIVKIKRKQELYGAKSKVLLPFNISVCVKLGRFLK